MKKAKRIMKIIIIVLIVFIVALLAICNRRSPTAAGAALNGSSAVTTAAI